MVDSKCMNKTAHWIRSGSSTKSSGSSGDNELCSYYENLDSLLNNNTTNKEIIKPEIYTLSSLKQISQSHNLCPYYLSRSLLSNAQIIIYSFHYLLDPQIYKQIQHQFSKDSIIVFDEGHNIDSVCIESMSVDISRGVVESAGRCLSRMEEVVDGIQSGNKERLEEEYHSLIRGLRQVQQSRDSHTQSESEIIGNPVLPKDLLEESIPGNIRKAKHFLHFLKRFLEFLKSKLKIRHVLSLTPLSFLLELKEMTCIDRKPLQFSSDRLNSLIKVLELRQLEELGGLHKIVQFATLVSTYLEGYILILEPYEGLGNVYNPVLHLSCLDASLAMNPIVSQYRNVILTSGTLSPLEMYPKILNYRESITVMKSFDMSLGRECFLPMVITRGNDQVSISSKFEVRHDPAVVRNYGGILLSFAQIVPDGLVCFFPSYIYMESIVSQWNEMRVLEQVLKYKLIFIETPDAAESSLALENYKQACLNGRGAVLLSVARGKVAEGIDFEHHFGRCVILFGIPYQYTESRLLRARLSYMRDQYGIRENEFLTFDAMRQAAQCVGRVIRGKMDYGLMVFADKRFARVDKRGKLPKWIGERMKDGWMGLSSDLAVGLGRRFFREMGQGYDLGGSVLLKEGDLINKESV